MASNCSDDSRAFNPAIMVRGIIVEFVLVTLEEKMGDEEFRALTERRILINRNQEF